LKIPFLEEINWIDILILILLGRGIFFGLRRGLTWALSSLVAVSLVSVATFFTAYPLAQWAAQKLHIPSPYLEWLSFILLALLFGSLAKLSVGLGVGGRNAKGFLDRIIGLCVGALRSSIVISLFLVIVVSSGFSYFGYSVKDRSLLGPCLLKITPTLFKNVQMVAPNLGGPSSRMWDSIAGK
jgi:uncharacterized membrane protein required for colicin V production